MRAIGIELTPGGSRKIQLSRHGDKFVVDRSHSRSAIRISATSAFHRVIEMPPLKGKEMRQALPFQIEPHLPYKAEEAIVEFVRLRSGLISVSALRKDKLRSHIEMLDEKPEMVASTASALAELLDYIFPSEETQAILHVAEKESTFAVVLKGAVLAARSFHTREDELEKTLYALSSKCRPDLEYSQIFLCGPSRDRVSLDAVELPTDSPFSLNFEKFSDYALPIGLALSVLRNKRSLNFFKDSPFPWRRLRGKLFLYCASSLLLAGGCYSLGQTIQKQRIEEISSNYRKVSRLAGRDFSASNVEEMLSEAKKLNIDGDAFPLQPDIPTLSELLSWLSMQQGIEVESFKYQMERQPTHKRPNDHYQVRINLDFSTKSPTMAREFHDALLEDPLVDTKDEVKWSQRGALYHASFLLRDRTRYFVAKS